MSDNEQAVSGDIDPRSAPFEEGGRPSSVVGLRRSKVPCGLGGEHNPGCFDLSCPFDAPDPDPLPASPA